MSLASYVHVITSYMHLFTELLLHPTIPLYNVAKCFTYKSYMVMYCSLCDYTYTNYLLYRWEYIIIKRYADQTLYCIKHCQQKTLMDFADCGQLTKVLSTKYF